MQNSALANLDSVKSRFEAIGGRFVTNIDDIADRLESCQAVVFDWDGVWNAGRKGAAAGSDFAEADSMGVNMLRFGFWRRTNSIPLAAIISGENNDSAVRFADREHFHDIYTRVANKRLVIEHICDRCSLLPEQIACVFDDINDLSMAGVCGLRVMVRRDASPMLDGYVARRSLCDYVTGSKEYAVRESCELMLGILGDYDEVLDSRTGFDSDYQDYFAARQAIKMQHYVMINDTIRPLDS